MAGRVAFSNVQKAQAASAYRSLIRSSKFTFQSDPQTYREFVGRAKDLFVTKVLNPTYLLAPSPDPKAASSSVSSNLDSQQDNLWVDRFDHEIRGVLELSKYLTRNIVQAKHSDDGQRLVVRFTDKTEIGDNSTIKNRSSTGSFQPTSSCCGGDHHHQPTDSTPPPPPPSRLSQAAIERREKRRLNRLQLSSS